MDLGNGGDKNVKILLRVREVGRCWLSWEFGEGY
jgi:hypothetical protein